ncbi:hypothetical protein Tco_1112753 [Tanacetum coccineum]|uniref:Uncharacterized protein n=1 Tax=Tanacetum coccineum TaxID=301880 RepID=A0ABQ5IQ69_9ASTR
MSSPDHPIANLEDAFSSNFPNYVPLASPNYVPASPGKTYSSASNLFGIIYLQMRFSSRLLSPTKSSSSTPFQTQTFEIGESSQKSTIERHEEQIEEILNHPVARMPPKRASTTEAPAMTQDAIELVG